MEIKMLTKFLIISFISFATNSEAAKKRVCIIGAGVSGLVSAKHFSEYPDEFETVVFEKNSDVGGLWIYTNSTTVDEHGLPVHSSIYQNLRTNTVKDIMMWPDYPYFGGKATDGRYLRHEDVLEHLRNYTDYFNLRKYIQFNTNVEKVNPLPNLRWSIVAQDLNTEIKSETSCDFVVICNGHDVKGFIPKIAGIENFTGKKLHSHVYRKPEPFTNQTVVVLGASSSGVDIAIDISSLATSVYLSHRHDKLVGIFPSNVKQVPGVVAAEGSYLILSNGSRIKTDALIFCTGYRYDFPFLDENSGIVVEDGKYIRSIYKHMINVERPTMAIIGAPVKVVFFQLVYAQVNYLRSVFRGELSLPSHEEMLLEAELSLKNNDSTGKTHNKSYDTFFKYFDELMLATGGKPLPWWFIPAALEIGKSMMYDPLHYRNKKLVIHEDDRRVEFV